VSATSAIVRDILGVGVVSWQAGTGVASQL
jgi:hypothetical protein